MKTFSPLKKVAAAISVLVAAGVCFAQPSGPGSPAGVDALVATLFGNVKAFSAKCDTRMLDGDQKETMSMTMDFALLDGKMRAEVDIAQMKNKDMPPGAAEMMKQSGMDRVISIVRPDKTNQIIVYPNLKSCLIMPLAKETIDGHACIKNKAIVTDAKGKTHEFTLWNATDLKDFPVQIQNTEDGTTTVMLFKQIQVAKPDAAKFEVPSDYKQYDDMQSFMRAMMSRMTGGAGAQ
jgi:hypothetical protein